MKKNKEEFTNIWDNTSHKIIDWWSYIADIEYLIVREEYKLAEEKLKTHFDELDDIETSDFNILSTLRQLKLYSEFCTNSRLKDIINFLENIKK